MVYKHDTDTTLAAFAAFRRRPTNKQQRVTTIGQHQTEIDSDETPREE